MKPSPTRDHVAACAGLLASRVPRCAVAVLAVAASAAASIPRPDARLILLAFGIAGQPGHRLLAAMQPDAAPLEAPPLAPSPQARTAAQALTAWRAAERRVQNLEEHTREWAVARAEVGRVRAEYQRLFAEHQRPIGRYPRANDA